MYTVKIRREKNKKAGNTVNKKNVVDETERTEEMQAEAFALAAEEKFPAEEEDFRECGEDRQTDSAAEDSLQLYLNRIGQETILTAEEERTLAELAKQGDLAARERLITANLRLVVSISKKYMGNGMNLSDLIEEGNIGLIKAVDKFDPQKGFRLSTFACWWIRQALTRALADKGRMIRLPVHVAEEVVRLRKAEKAMTLELGRAPSYRELARAMNMKEDRLSELMEISENPASLDMKVGDGQDEDFGSLLEDPSAPDPEELCLREQLKFDLAKLLQCLPEKERFVICSRFGLGGYRRSTLEETGKSLGVTRERCRQIQEHALKLLRRQPGVVDLQEYLAG